MTKLRKDVLAAARSYMSPDSFDQRLYGCRVTDKPSFYLHGAIISPRLWAKLPTPNGDRIP